MLPLPDTCYWVRTHHEIELSLLWAWEPRQLALIWPLLRFLRPRHTVRPEHKIQWLKYDMGRWNRLSMGTVDEMAYLLEQFRRLHS